jgi:hypothetical protein
MESATIDAAVELFSEDVNANPKRRVHSAEVLLIRLTH